MTDIPTDLRYGADHMWASSTAGSTVVRVGITDHAQEALGDIISVTDPREDDTTEAGAPCGEIESTKTVSDLIAPVTGTVRARNTAAEDAPELINSDPYGRGWLFDVDVEPATLDEQLAALMDGPGYRQLVGDQPISGRDAVVRAASSRRSP